MTMTSILAVIGGTVLIIGAAARIPNAVAELIRACVPVITAFGELRATLERAAPGTGQSGREEHDRT
ncbi:hypothetical protein SAVIM338S_00165 [Streptomyces avidinii]